MLARALEAQAALPVGEDEPDERALLLVLAADAYQSRGESVDARRVLASLRELEHVEEGIEEAVESLVTRLDRERDGMVRAIPGYARHAASDQVGQEGRAILRYLVAELRRKVGDTEKALAELRALSEDEGVSPELMSWIRDAQEKAGGRHALP